MKKYKLLVGVIVVVITMAMALVGCGSDSLNQADGFWDKTEGEYIVDYIVTDATGASIGISMVEKYCILNVRVQFADEKYKLFYSMNSRKMEGVAIKVGEEWLDLIEQEDSTDSNVIYMIELDSKSATGDFKFKTEVAAMSFKVEFEISLDTINAVLV